MAVKVGTVPVIGLLNASKSEMVMVASDEPSAEVGPEPVMAAFAAVAGPGEKTTVPPALLIGDVIVSVLVSALVDVNVHVADQLESVAEQAP